MTTDKNSRDYLAGLYNGYNSVAERVDPNRLKDIHISTKLDEQIKIWIQQKKDIILTGNPGDGKTHLINFLEQTGGLYGSYAEKDASQQDTDTTLRTWSEKKRDGVPFIIAINHAPLRALAQRASNYSNIAYLTSVSEEIDNLTFYNQAQQSVIKETIIVDLGQRELLNGEVVTKLIRKLCSIATPTPCLYCPPNRCPVEYNVTALSHDHVIKNLVTLLELVARRGFHTTMRDLVGLLAYIITSDQPCQTRWQSQEEQEPVFETYAYYNLLFSGRNKLFDAIRSTFDPGMYADARTDMDLWNGVVTQGWCMSEPTVTVPATLAELRKLKRRYFFEHMLHDTQELLKGVLPTTEHNFDLLVQGKCDERSAAEDLVNMINMLYAPQHSTSRRDLSNRLRLWNNHRYAVGSTKGYVAMRSISVDNLVIYWPKPAPYLEGAVNVRRDHVLLGVTRWQPGDAALQVDWTMYQALAAARQGTPIDLQPFHILRRLDLFLRSLGSEYPGTREIETVEWSDHRRRLTHTVRVNRTTRQYE